MPPWVLEILIPGGGLLLIAGGLKAWWNDWREARKAARDATEKDKKDLQEEVKSLRGKVESLLMDAIARERETNALRAERLAMDKQFAALATAMTAALERSKTKDGP